MIRILILAIVEAAAILFGSKCLALANDTPDGGSAALFLLGACLCAVFAVAVLAAYFGTRSAFIALLLLLIGCIGSVETTAHMNRRLAAVEYGQEQRYELSDCHVTSPPDPNGLFGRVTMRCTMGEGTRWEERNVLVFCEVKDAEVCR